MFEYIVCINIHGEGIGNPLQYSCPESPMDRGPDKLQSMGSQKVGYDLATKTKQNKTNKQTKTNPEQFIHTCTYTHRASLIAQLVKNPPAMQETPV